MKTVIAAALLLAGVSATSRANVIVFSDGNFNTGWSDIAVSINNTTSHTFITSNPSSGGAPGFYRQEIHTATRDTNAPSLAGLQWFAANSAANYNPSVEGAITSINVSYDLINLNLPVPGFTNVNVGYGVGVEQGGRYYRAYFGDIGGSAWTSFSHLNLTSASFQEVLPGGPYPHIGFSSQPNFSATGSNLRFGYWILNGISGSIAGTTGIDNWNVTITNEAPEPATFAIAGAGLLGMAFFRRRRARS